MKTRIVETKFWKDNYVVDLSPEEKLLYLFFLTSERVNILHCYEVTDREIAFDTGIDTPIIRGVKKKFEKDGKLSFYKNYVCLINAYKYESYTGPLNENAKLKLLKQMNPDVEKWYRGIYRGIDTPIAIPSINHKSEIISNNSETGKGYKSFKKVGSILKKTAK